MITTPALPPPDPPLRIVTQKIWLDLPLKYIQSSTSFCQLQLLPWPTLPPSLIKSIAFSIFPGPSMLFQWARDPSLYYAK